MPTSSIPDLPLNAQPFHEGEREVQSRVGVRERMAATGPRVFHDFMPEQHREFFRQLPFVTVGCVDARGQPWASVLANPPGFIDSPDPRRLTVRARPLAADPLDEILVKGASIGLLGIEPHTRRRNRLNGIVEQVTDQGFSVHVRQSFGNCPKYIQARKPEYASGAAKAPAVHRSERLDLAAQQMIRRADTFFIATAYPAARGDDAPAHGVDVSHRGGKPGFVRVDDERSFTIPDFVGNFLFNTLGNIAINPKAGLLFIDFESGDLLYLACDAEIVWKGREIEEFKGAERLLRFHVRELKRVDGSLPLRWGEAQLSPFLERTGEWTA
jgi:predicted pyridoxine 5'-phosphate oxidase superfamily flavin-nucleotide-binding protein